MALSNIKLGSAVLYIHIYFEIEDFEEGISDDFKDIIEVLTVKLSTVDFNIAFKTHGTDSKGNTLKESTILIV
jgi:hypothetical protein